MKKISGRWDQKEYDSLFISEGFGEALFDRAEVKPLGEVRIRTWGMKIHL